MHISVFGSGYLATVLSACLADFGVPVTCVDEDLHSLGALAQGKVPYFEKNLEEILKRGVRSGRVTFTTDASAAVRKSEIIYLASDCAEMVEETAVRIARMSPDEKVLVIAAPVLVGSSRRIAERVREAGDHLCVVTQPLFLTHGCAVEDFNWPDRILLGTTSGRAVAAIKQIYRPLVMRGVPVIVTSFETAELARAAATGFLATKISFMNELSELCEFVKADAMDLALALGLDKRIAPRCLTPGTVLGGGFAESDLDSLTRLAAFNGQRFKVLSAAREVQNETSERVLNKIHAAMRSVQGKQVGLLGLAFKPNTNSVTSSASIELARKLLSEGAKVKAYDPVALSDAKSELTGTVYYCDSPYDAAEDSDLLVLSTGWPEFRALDFGRIKRSVRRPLILDTKNLLDAGRMRSMGFEYMGMGRC